MSPTQNACAVIGLTLDTLSTVSKDSKLRNIPTTDHSDIISDKICTKTNKENQGVGTKLSWSGRACSLCNTINLIQQGKLCKNTHTKKKLWYSLKCNMNSEKFIKIEHGKGRYSCIEDQEIGHINHNGQ